MKLLGLGTPQTSVRMEAWLTWCSEDVWDLESLKNNNIPRHLLSHTNSISTLMIRDWREAGRQPQSPRHWRGICLSNWATLSEREERRDRAERSQSVSIVSLLADTKYVSGQLQLVRASAPAVTVCISVISPLSTASFHISSLSCDKKSPNPEHWYWGFCFRSSVELSVYKDTTLTSTAFCPASNITLSLTDRISFPLQLYFCYLQQSS